MASRQEEKQRRREERLAQEAAAARAVARRNVVQKTATAVLAAAVVAASIYAITTTGGGTVDAAPAADGSVPAIAVPAQRVTDVKRAAAAAGCQLRSFKSFGQEHTTDKVTYETNPPTSGPHNPVPAADGAYAPDSPPGIGNAVHALEHGRVEIQWRPGLPVRRIGQLQSLFEEQAANHVLLFANQTGMPFAVAASAWRHYLGCRTFSPKVFDAIRTFRAAYTDKAPELVP